MAGGGGTYLGSGSGGENRIGCVANGGGGGGGGRPAYEGGPRNTLSGDGPRCGGEPAAEPYSDVKKPYAAGAAGGGGWTLWRAVDGAGNMGDAADSPKLW